MFCQASKYDQMLTEQVNILYTFVIKGTVSVQNRFVSDFRPQLLLTAVHCSQHTVVFTTAGWFPKARNQNKFYYLFFWDDYFQWAGILSWFNQFRNRGSKSLSAILSAVGNWLSKILVQWKRNLTTLGPRFTKKRTQATQESGRKDGRRWDGGSRDWWHV